MVDSIAKFVALVLTSVSFHFLYSLFVMSVTTLLPFVLLLVLMQLPVQPVSCFELH